MKDFAGKTAFITGGACGAGLGYAQVFSEAGMKVVIADNRKAHLEDAKAYFADKDVPVHFIDMDVTDRAAFAAAADECEKVFGVPDLLILNAGVNVFGPAEASTYDDFDWVMDNVYGGTVNGLVTFVPRMIKAGGAGRYIAATVSWGAFGPGAVVAPYCAAKAAQLNLMESYWLALKPYGIGVSAITPANICTNIWDSSLYGRPEKYGNTGYNVTEETQAFLSTIHVHGMKPRVLANWLKQGIEKEQFLIVPYEHGERMVELALERFKYYATIEGQKAWEAKQAAGQTEEEFALHCEREGMDMKSAMANRGKSIAAGAPAKDVGFGKARGDLDWVLESKRYKG